MVLKNVLLCISYAGKSWRMDGDTWRVTRGGGKSWTRDKDVGNVDGCVE